MPPFLSRFGAVNPYFPIFVSSPTMEPGQPSGSTSYCFFVRQSGLRACVKIIEDLCWFRSQQPPSSTFLSFSSQSRQDIYCVHMSPLSSTPFSSLGQLPDNLYLYQRSGLFICPSPVPFGSRKATCSVYISFQRLGLSHRCPLFSITSPRSFPFGISTSIIVYSTVSTSCRSHFTFSPI